MNVRYRVELSQAERAELTTLLSRGKHAARKLKRAQILVAADAGASDDEIARAVAVGGSTVYRTKRRFVEGNLERALSEEPRPGADRKLTGKEEALLVATACASPPEGRARWTLNLLADAIVKLTDHQSLSRETVRRRLAENDLKPWRRDMWCIPQVDGEYVARMEDVLDLYAEAPDPKRPVICFDESPVQLIGEVRQPIPAAPGQLERYDYEYRRNGTVNLFVVLDVRKVDVDEVAQALSIVARRAALGEADLAPRSMGDRLDLAAAGFKRVTPKVTGRPGYAPGDLLKLYIYGYLNRVRSSRRLEAECHRNIEVIWLLRTLKPDFKTIVDFRSDNRAAFRAVFRQFTLLCRELNLFGCELLAVDGTRIKAVNNKDRNFTKNSLEKFIKAADRRLDEYLRRLDESDFEEAATDGSRTKNLVEKIEALREKRGRYEALLTELERSGENQISLTDPDSRAMAAHTRVAVGYNIQVAVDAKNKMIVDQEVTNQVVDMGLLTQTAEPARAILEVETIDVVADRGYFKIEDIEACEKAGMTPYVPKPQRGSSVSNGFFRKDEFRYDAERDAFICPAGQVLSTRYESKLRELTKIDYSNRAACLVCAIKSRCTKNYRKVSRLENEAVLDRMAARLKARPEILDRRREMVEHPFGSIKQWMNQGAFLMKGLDNVRAEFSLTALVYNLRRALNILGVEAMMAAARG